MTAKKILFLVGDFVSLLQHSTLSRPLVAGLVAGALVTGALAQSPAVTLDVPYVPTPASVVARMLDMADLRKDDVLIDLGSGDGRIAVAAGARGARAVGIDINPVRIREANANAARAGVTGLVSFRQQNLFETPIAEATVLTLYLLERVNLELRPRILSELRPGTRVVSHAFDMGEWRPDRQENVDGRDVYLWIVPAQVEGRWHISNGARRFAVDLTQRFQEIRGTATIDGRSVPLNDLRLRGDQIQFTLDTGDTGPLAFRGRVAGNTIEAAPAQTRSGAGPRSAENWQATRGS
jgi:Methyltransferase domain